LGNLIVPAQIGAQRMAFPRLNAVAFWLTALALMVLLLATFTPGGGPISGWTSYPPLSAIASAGPGQALGMDLWLLSIGIFCIASTLGAVNMVTTIITARCEGMTWERLPLTVWSWFTASLLTTLVFSVLFAAVVMLFCDRHLGTSFFIPTSDLVNGVLYNNSKNGGDGSPLLWLHLFWFFGHPEVYIAVLPGMGITSMLLANFSRRRVFGYRLMIITTLAIGFLGLLLWGHHMYVAGLNPWAGSAFAATTMAIAIPSAGQGAELAGNGVAQQAPIRYTHALVAWLCFTLHHRRTDGANPGAADSGQLSAQYVFCGRPFSSDYGDGRNFQPVCGHVLLVSADDRAIAE
jgi:cytochrome c oxidase subunit 1